MLARPRSKKTKAQHFNRSPLPRAFSTNPTGSDTASGEIAPQKPRPFNDLHTQGKDRHLCLTSLHTSAPFAMARFSVLNEKHPDSHRVFLLVKFKP